jgi:hypothetical protein
MSKERGLSRPIVAVTIIGGFVAAAEIELMKSGTLGPSKDFAKGLAVALATGGLVLVRSDCC